MKINIPHNSESLPDKFNDNNINNVSNNESFPEDKQSALKLDKQNEAQSSVFFEKERNKESTSLLEEFNEIYADWTCPAYRQTQKSTIWYILMGSLMTGFILYGLFSGESYGWIVSFTFILLVAVYLWSEKQVVPLMRVRVSSWGLKVNSKTYGFDQIKAFWMLIEPDARVLHIELYRGAQKHLSLPIPRDINPAELREFLRLYVQELEGKKESFSDAFLRNLGF